MDSLRPWIFPSSEDSNPVEMIDAGLHNSQTDGKDRQEDHSMAPSNDSDNTLVKMQHSAVCLENHKYFADSQTTTHPLIVPDSPSVFFGPSNPIFYLREEQSPRELYDVQKPQNLILSMSDSIKTQDNTARLDPRNIKESAKSVTPSKWPFKPDGRFVQDLESKCALCPQTLGPSYDALYEHVRRHLQQCSSPEFECFMCGVQFAFERDLMLHKKPIEMTNFSREFPAIDAYDNQDWIADASRQDRETFIDGLRQWERFQMHLFLATIQNAFVQSKQTPARAVVSAYVTSSNPRTKIYTNTRSQIQCSSGRLCITNNRCIKSPIRTDELVDMFSQTSLVDAIRRRRPSKAPMPRLLLQILSLDRNMSVHNAAAVGDPALVETALHHFCIEDDYSSHSWQLVFIESCHRGHAAVASALLDVRGKSRRLVKYAWARAFCKVLAAGLHCIFRDMLELRPRERYDNSQIEEALGRFGVCPWACSMIYVSPRYTHVSQHFCKTSGPRVWPVHA